jgi:dTDP-4-dehydrorhamnose 3,5-epimerase-like enzyme
MLAIEWPLKPTDISERDKNHKMINNDFRGVKL